MSFMTICFGGLLVNCLCGICIGGTVAVVLKQRMRPRSIAIVISMICVLVVGASLAILWKTHGEGFFFYAPGLIIYPFINRITIGSPFTFIPAILFDIGLMTLSGVSTWKLMGTLANEMTERKKIMQSEWPPRYITLIDALCFIPGLLLALLTLVETRPGLGIILGLLAGTGTHRIGISLIVRFWPPNRPRTDLKAETKNNGVANTRSEATR